MIRTTIRDIPDDVYNEIVEEAKRQKRSINSQIVIGLMEYANWLKQQKQQQAKKQQE